MYLRLILKGISRHKKKGKRLFILIALSTAAIIFLLTFQKSFRERYIDLYIGASTGHIQILSPENSILKNDNLISSETLPLIEIDSEFEKFIHSLKGVEEAGQYIQTIANSFNLDGEGENFYYLVGVSASKKNKLFPVNTPVEGNDNIRWDFSQKEIPVAAPKLEKLFGFNENNDHTSFNPEDLRIKGELLEDFKVKLALDIPVLFSQKDFSTEANNTNFFEVLSSAIQQKDLFKLFPLPEKYNWKIDDAINAIMENKNPGNIPFLNKRLFKAYYDEEIASIKEPIKIGKSVTIQIPPAKTIGDISTPIIIPAKYVGFMEIMPLYMHNAFIDIEALQNIMGLKKEECLSYMIRLVNRSDTGIIKSEIETYLKERKLPYVVVDYKQLSSVYEPTSIAIDVISNIVIIVITIIVLILIINMCMLMVISRRREIGTSIAIGLANSQNIFVMLGEVWSIASISWLAGCVLGGILVTLGAIFGVPGMIFFPYSKLYLLSDPSAFITAYLILVPSSLIAAFVPFLSVHNKLPADLLKEAK